MDGVTLRAPIDERCDQILKPAALQFVAELHRKFNSTRLDLLQARTVRQAQLDRGERPGFLPQTQSIRAGEWRIGSVPADLADRRVEITGPTERKMMINALNSGAKVFMADLEDATSPTWANVVEGQVNLAAAVAGRLTFTSPEGKTYRVSDTPATLVVRPRGWHLDEHHLLIDGDPVSASLFDFGLYLFHNAQLLVAKGTGPYFYLPKLESHLEARLWHDVFQYAEERLGLPQSTIKATVLIETILGAFEMEEILYELRAHVVGLNAGRWDYIFSLIKKFRNFPDFQLPDRSQVSMNVPFMRAYTELLVSTCHRRGAHAIGGMAAFIPSRRDAQVNEVALSRVREDKRREASDGFDGTWVAHPDLVPVAQAVFDKVLGSEPNQLTQLRADVLPNPDAMLNVKIHGGAVTETGLRTNIAVGIQYLESWLRGVGAVGINNLMEDAATAEISRSQVWQWVRHGARLKGSGAQVTTALVRLLITEEVAEIRRLIGEAAFHQGRFAEATALFTQMSIGDTFGEFLTIPAYAYIQQTEGVVRQ